MATIQHEMFVAIRMHQSQYGSANGEQLAGKLYDMAVTAYVKAQAPVEPAPVAEPEPAPTVEPVA